VRCNAITGGGDRCKLEATHGSYCWSHAPETADERRQRARRGGKAGGRGRPGADLADLKRDVRGVIDGVLDGTIPQGPGAVALQGYNTLLRAAKVEMDIREQQELIERLEALEAAQERQKEGGKRWGV
jgi:predicted dehydrogenase